MNTALVILTYILALAAPLLTGAAFLVGLQAGYRLARAAPPAAAPLDVATVAREVIAMMRPAQTASPEPDQSDPAVIEQQYRQQIDDALTRMGGRG